LSAIYLHNVAIARLSRACAVSPDALDFSRKPTPAEKEEKEKSTARVLSVAQPPTKLTQQ
jgi:hypothetical protein